ncbi:MAG: amidase [Desulfomonile tiedjei]|nr:amidase [Desulfomonile tiedjei]
MASPEVPENSPESNAFVEIFALEPKGSGPLDGLVFAAKDLIDVEGRRTSCGNPSWRDTHPVAAANAVCVDQLLFAGARCIGKTITDELAFGLNGENFFYGTPLNPRAPERVPGGSSSGSASAVACGRVDFALGTDTGGSVRVPASNCGIFGLRPSHGIVSVAGVNPLAPSFDTVGVLARSSAVLNKAASVLLACEVPRSIEVGTVHLLEEAFSSSDPEVDQALREPVELIERTFPGKLRETSLKELGEEASRRGLAGWYDTYCQLQWAEIWSCLGSWVTETRPRFGPRTAANFDLVKNFDRQHTVDAIRRREIYYRSLKRFLGPNDLICIPTTPTLAPIKGTLGVDRTQGDYYPRTLAMTAIAGIGRLPQVTLPVASVGGVPIGLSLLAAQGMDAFLLAAARMISRHPEHDTNA